MASPVFSPLRQRLDAGILTLTLDRPDHGNALTPALIDALHEALDRAELDAGVRVVVIRGAGEDFSLGGDPETLLASADATLADNERSVSRLTQLFGRCRELPKPVVAVVQGRALGEGAGLATACDLVLADERATIGYPAIRHGMVAATTLALLRRLVGERLAVDLALSGRLLAAPDALAAGLITHVASAEELERVVAALLEQLIAANAAALALTKRLVYQSDILPLPEALALGARADALARAAPEFRAAAVRFLRR